MDRRGRRRQHRLRRLAAVGKGARGRGTRQPERGDLRCGVANQRALSATEILISSAVCPSMPSSRPCFQCGQAKPYGTPPKRARAHTPFGAANCYA
eukprot:scaffold19911_cov59-Phaeocystis_antarctica.AAC.8